MSLVKQTHELPCPHEALPHSHQAIVPRSFTSGVDAIMAPWKVDANQITGSKPFRREVSLAKAKSESLKAKAIQRTYFPTTIR
jgi:hypothetical protein